MDRYETIKVPGDGYCLYHCGRLVYDLLRDGTGEGMSETSLDDFLLKIRQFFLINYNKECGGGMKLQHSFGECDIESEQQADEFIKKHLKNVQCHHSEGADFFFNWMVSIIQSRSL